MNKKENLEELIRNLPPQVSNVIVKVIKAECEKSHMKKPKGIIDEIRQIIEQESDRNET